MPEGIHYDNWMDAFMEVKYPVSTEDHTNTQLWFWVDYDTEAGRDFLQVQSQFGDLVWYAISPPYSGSPATERLLPPPRELPDATPLVR